MTGRRRSSGQGTLFKRTEGGNSLASWYDHNGRRKERSTRTTDRRVAERILSKYVADSALRLSGVIDPQLDAICDESQRSVDKHLVDYEAKMRTANRTPKHITTTVGYIRRFAESSDWATVGDISADEVNRYAATMKEEGRSAQTVKNLLTAVKGFTKWLANNQELPRDPLASVSKPNPKADRRRERRMLLPDEWKWLQPITANGPERYGVPGPERALLYATAIQTGLRANELRSLTRGQLFLKVEQPYITCKAGSTKNRRDARQYVQCDLAAGLQQHVAKKAPQAPVFAMPSEYDLADMLREDLVAARQAWLDAAKHDPEEYERQQQGDFLAAVNHEGEQLDFHSLRHSTGAWLAMRGAHPNEVKAVMRHSAITLTMDTYGHLFPGQEAKTVARFGDLMGDGPEALQATGTADATASARYRHQPKSQQSECFSQRAGASQCDKSDNTPSPPSARNPLETAGISDTVRRDATGNDTAPRRARTYDLLIKNQLLCRLS